MEECKRYISVRNTEECKNYILLLLRRQNDDWRAADLYVLWDRTSFFSDQSLPVPRVAEENEKRLGRDSSWQPSCSATRRLWTNALSAEPLVLHKNEYYRGTRVSQKWPLIRQGWPSHVRLFYWWLFVDFVIFLSQRLLTQKPVALRQRGTSVKLSDVHSPTSRCEFA